MQTGEKHMIINSIFFILLLLSGRLTILRKKCTRPGKQTRAGREVIRVGGWAAKADRIERIAHTEGAVSTEHSYPGKPFAE